MEYGRNGSGISGNKPVEVDVIKPVGPIRAIRRVRDSYRSVLEQIDGFDDVGVYGFDGGEDDFQF